MPTNTISPDIQQDLAEHAIAIRDLSKRTVENVITNAFEIGRHLTEAHKIADHGDWLPWLKREFGWSESTARRWMRIYELGKSVTVTDLKLSLGALYLLSAPSTPDEVRDKVIASARAGEDVPVSEIKAAVAEQKAAVADEPNDETEDETADEQVDTTDDELEDELEDEDEDSTDDDDDDAGDDRLAEKLRAAEFKIIGLESEIEELKAARDQLRARVAELEGENGGLWVEKDRLQAELEAKQKATTEKQGETTLPKPKRGRRPGSLNRADAHIKDFYADASVASSSVIENSTVVENAPATPAPATIGVTEPMPEFLKRAS
jgi:regulator of replication initiation timing